MREITIDILYGWHRKELLILIFVICFLQEEKKKCYFPLEKKLNFQEYIGE